MKKRAIHRARHHKTTHHAKRRVANTSTSYLLYYKGWMFMVAFAIMMGVGVLVGTFFRMQFDAAYPTVAGVQTSR